MGVALLSHPSLVCVHNNTWITQFREVANEGEHLGTLYHMNGKCELNLHNVIGIETIVSI